MFAFKCNEHRIAAGEQQLNAMDPLTVYLPMFVLVAFIPEQSEALCSIFPVLKLHLP